MVKKSKRARKLFIKDFAKKIIPSGFMVWTRLISEIIFQNIPFLSLKILVQMKLRNGI